MNMRDEAVLSLARTFPYARSLFATDSHAIREKMYGKRHERFFLNLLESCEPTKLPKSRQAVEVHVFVGSAIIFRAYVIIRL